MYILQSKHIKLNEKEIDKLLSDFNISKNQLPKILIDDPGLVGEFNIGDIVKIERMIDGELNLYYRVVV